MLQRPVPHSHQTEGIAEQIVPKVSHRKSQRKSFTYADVARGNFEGKMGLQPQL